MARRRCFVAVEHDEAPDPVCVSLFRANAVVLEATDGSNLIEQFRIVQSLRIG